MTTLGGGTPHLPGVVRDDRADVLYATDRDGREVKLAGIDVPLGGALPLDLGMPSVGPDGTIFFGAAFRRRNRVRWEIFSAKPDTHQIREVFEPDSRGAALELVADPTPLAEPDGSLVFGAAQESGGSVYRLAGGKLTCLLRTGADLGDGRILKNIGFGTIVAAPSTAVALLGYLARRGKAVLLISNGSTIVLAEVGKNAPDGARYRDLGRPAVSGLRSVNIAFPAVTDHGSRLYELGAVKSRAILAADSACPGGRITYISLDKAGFNSDGAIAAEASCSGVPAIFIVKGSQVTMLVSAIHGTDYSRFADLGRLSLLDSGTVIFGATDSNGAEELFSISSDSSSASETGAALPLISAGDSLVPPLHSILTVSVDINQHGRMAYLGSPVESLASGQTQ